MTQTQNNSNLIRAFSKAIFAIASEYHAQEQFLLFLGSLNNIAKHRLVKKLFKNNTISSADKADFLLQIMMINNQIEFAMQNKFINLIKLLSTKNYLLLLPNIYQQYDKLYLQNANIMRVTITSAIVLDDNQKQALLENLTKYFNKELLLIYKIDAAIIAGLTIKYNDETLDYSFKNKLLNLQYILKNA